MKSGFVSILGRPNVGKSTLLNAFLNQKISIVADKSQTTRNTIKGIYNAEGVQIVFTDTPGIHKPKEKLSTEMNNMAYSAAHDVDVNILVVDASEPFGPGDEYILNHLDINNSSLIIVFNKIDLARLDKVLKIKEIYKEKAPKAIIMDTVAKDRFNVDELLKEIINLLPEGPAFYSTEEITDKDVIFQIKEIIREKVIRNLRDEVPHATAVYMEDIDWESEPIHIKANIIVEKDGQKGIVIGAGGKRIKTIGQQARKDIEELLHKHVFLELFVKVEDGWRDNDKSLETYGYKFKK